MTTESEVLDRFRALCEETYAAEDSADDEGVSTYDALLRFIQAHPEHKATLVSRMVDIVRQFQHVRIRGSVDLSPDAIGYCMKVLRWPEVFDAAEQAYTEYFMERRSALLAPIFDAYRDSGPASE